MASEVEINVKTIADQAIKDLNKTADAVGGVSGSANKSQQATVGASMKFTELASAVSLARQGIDALQYAYNEVIAPTIEYAQQVQDLSRITGNSADATSRMIQVADDVRLSYDELRTSMQIASKQGIDVTADGIANLADEYLRLNPGVDRAQFLLTTFGRSGAAMGRLLEKGGAGIRSMYGEVNKSLIITEDGINAAEEYRLAVDALGEAWEGFRNEIAIGVLPTLTGVIEAFTAAKESADEYGIVAGNLVFIQGLLKEANDILHPTIQDTTDALNTMATATDPAAEGLENAVSPAENYAEALKDVAAGWKDLQDVQQSWLENTANEVVTALDGLWMSDKAYKEALAAIDDVYGTSEEAELEHKEAIEEMTRAYAQTGDIDTFKEALRGLKDEELPQTTEQLEAARKKANDLELQLQTLKNMSPIHVKIILDQEGNVPFGGGNGYWDTE